jgi:Gram-negative porin
MQKPTIQSNTLAVLAASTVMLLPASAGAFEFTLSGQVNRLIMNVDNGEESGVVNADSSVSGTRVRLKGHGDVGNDLTAGLYYEYQLQSNPSDKITADDLDSDGSGGNLGGGDNFSNRNANIWFKGNFGKVTLGQGSGAADGSTEADKSGTTVVQYASGDNDLLGSMEYGDSGVTVSDARNAFDGLGRNDNIRYDAAIENFSLAGSYGNGDKVELAARYKQDDLEVRIAAWDTNDSTDDSITGYAISGTWMAQSGFNLTGSYAGNDSDGDPDNTYVKAGYKTGNNSFAVDWSETTDKAAGDGSSVSVAWVNQLIAGVEIYASYRVESLDDVSGEDDIDALIGGARVKF